MAVLAGQVEWSEPHAIDAVHEAVRLQQHLYNVAVTRPRCFVKSSVSELHRKKAIAHLTLTNSAAVPSIFNWIMASDLILGEECTALQKFAHFARVTALGCLDESIGCVHTLCLQLNSQQLQSQNFKRKWCENYTTHRPFFRKRRLRSPAQCSKVGVPMRRATFYVRSEFRWVGPTLGQPALERIRGGMEEHDAVCWKILSSKTHFEVFSLPDAEVEVSEVRKRYRRWVLDCQRCCSW